MCAAFVIRNFSEKTHCHNEDELKATLKCKFLGKHVTVIRECKSGIKIMKFITVLTSGSIIDTYSLQPIESFTH